MSHRGPTNHGERDYLRLGTSAFCYSHIWKFFYHMDLVIIRKHYFHWFSSIWYAAGMVRMWWLKLSLLFLFLVEPSRLKWWQSKLGCVVRMVVDSILSHAEIGPNDHRKDAPRLELFHRRYHEALLSISFNILTDTLLLLLIATSKLESK